MLHTSLQEVATAHQHPPVVPAAAEEHQRLRVLVVDDQEVVHWGFKMLLARRTWVEGYAAVSTLAEALEVAERDRPNVAIVGAVVGLDSGTEITRQLREASPTTHVLLMATGGRVSARSARAAGAYGYVPK